MEEGLYGPSRRGVMREPDERLADELRNVVERQLQQPDLEEVNHTVDRITEYGFSRAEAIDTVRGALLAELNEMRMEGEPFDRERYVDRLEEL